MIVWLEDRKETIRAQLIQLDKKSIPYTILPSPATFKQYIEEEEDNIINRSVIFVIDIMLHGINDLRSIGIDHAPTLAGNHTGFVFVDRFLRATNSKWKRIPVCFLTERDADGGLDRDVNSLGNKGDGAVEICRKYSDGELNRFLALLSGWLGEQT